MNSWLLAAGFLLLGYLSGSLPFSVWVTKAAIGKDVRDGGSGHATTTNTVRQAGYAAGAIVLILDMLKGFVPVFLAMKYAPFGWVPPLVVGLAVVGHCWPVLAGFRGGMGLAVAGAGLLAVQWSYALIGLGLLLVFNVVIKHSARAALFTGILISPLMLLVGASKTLVWASLAAGCVIAIRFLSEWNRQYKEKWLDGNWH